MSEEDTVSIPVKDLLRVFKDLEEYVVSLDRILSRIQSGGDPAILVKYVSQRDIFRRIAQDRYRLVELLAPIVGQEELEQVAEEAYVFTDS